MSYVSRKIHMRHVVADIPERAAVFCRLKIRRKKHLLKNLHVSNITIDSRKSWVLTRKIAVYIPPP